MIRRWLIPLCLVAALSSLGKAQQLSEPLHGSALIDQWIRAAWKERDLKPASPCRDMEFLRRASLDIVGVIPSLEEAEGFLADPDPRKRARLVDRLLGSPQYAEHWADVWTSILLGTHSAAPQDLILHFKARAALKSMLDKNLPYDQFARAILTAQGSVYPLPAPMMAQAGPEAPAESGLAIYVYKAFRDAQRDLPKALAGKLTRIFMGVQIQCAQCHDHPFDRWTQEEFYGMASFFTEVGVRRETIPDPEPPGQAKKPPQYYFSIQDRPPGMARRGFGMGPGMGLGMGMDLVIPDSKGGPVRASFLETGKGVVRGTPRRAQFAQYMTGKENLQFARMAVNRLWAHFFGSGIVNPPDDFSGKNRPLHPELLDRLAADFIEQGFDTHSLIRAIALSEAYGLSSGAKERPREAEKFQALSRVRALSPEQILRSIFRAVGPARAASGQPLPGEDLRRRRLFSLAAQFRYAFGDDEGGEVTDFTGSIPSALLMMNSDLVGRGSSARAGTLAEILSREKTPEARIREIFLLVLSRTPSEGELKRWSRGTAEEKGTGVYEDLVWTLLNTSEFLFNH